MPEDKFREIWKNIVLPTYEELNKHGELFIKRNAFERVYKEYQKQKTYIKQNYMENPNTHLDRHKVAACVMYAIVSVHPVETKASVIWEKYKKKEQFSRQSFLWNEYLGLYTALSIVNSFQEEKCRENPEAVCKMIKIPKTSNGEDYIYNTCLDLYYSRKKNKINILTFANVFFLLEAGEFETDTE